MAPSELIRRFHALRDVLAAHAHLWRPVPFHEPRPAWCDRYPELDARLRQLTRGEVDALGSDNHALIDLLAAHAPGLAAIHGLIDLPGVEPGVEDLPPPRVLAHVPGRKLSQITAFAAALGEVAHPVLEWCAGKGHLGRLLAWRQPHPVDSLEIDPALIEAGEQLSRRAGLAQHFIPGDALAPETAAHLTGRHAVALHACGELHLSLLRRGAMAGVPALDLAPCCYYRIPQERYPPLCEDAGLDLSRDELHLAVTETVTAGGRDRRRSRQAMAWKLAFLELRAQAGIGHAVTFPPVPEAWLALGFEGWMSRLCKREGVAIPAGCRWIVLEQSGWRRAAEVLRLDLVRLAFRRPLEVWLALDRCVFLERHGYRLQLRVFCDSRLTPRNLLISARL